MTCNGPRTLETEPRDCSRKRPLESPLTLASQQDDQRLLRRKRQLCVLVIQMIATERGRENGSGARLISLTCRWRWRELVTASANDPGPGDICITLTIRAHRIAAMAATTYVLPVRKYRPVGSDSICPSAIWWWSRRPQADGAYKRDRVLPIFVATAC